MEQCGGGVGRNMAEALWKMREGRVRLLTAVGDDADGHFLVDIAPGLLLDGCMIKEGRTSTYAAVLDSKGECLMGLGDMALHNHISIDMVDRHRKVLEQAPLVVIDGNIPQPTMDHVLKLCHEIETPVFFEPTDKRKAVKALASNYRLTYASPNLSELISMAAILQPTSKTINNFDEINEVLQLSRIVLQKIDILIVTIGAKGVLTIRKHQKDSNVLDARLYPVKVLKQIQNVSGAGDCFASGFINGILSNKEQSLCVSIGFQAAISALLSKNTIPSNFTVDNVTKNNYIMLDTHTI